MSVYTDLLPATRSEPKGAAFDWTVATTPGPLAGVLTIKNRRIYTSYRVLPFPVDGPGRGFRLVKTSCGSDPSETFYCCLLIDTMRRCDCKGYASTGGCKHLLAVAALLEAGKL